MLGHRELNVEDYLSILKRRWWLIAIPAIVAPILAIGSTFFITPQYVSQSLVLIDQPKVSSELVKSVVTEDLSNRLASMKEQIFSRYTLQPIIEKYNLYTSQHLDMDARLILARNAIDVKPIQSILARANGLPGFKIFFTANDPHTAQQVCAEITSLFTGANLRSREATAEGTTDFLKEQLDQAKHTLDDQDAKLAAFESQHFGMLPGDESNNVNILGSLNSQLDATTQNIQNLEQGQSVMEAMLAQQSQPVAPTAAAKTPQAEEQELKDLEAQEADLTAHYTPDYPDVKAIHRKIQDLQKQMAQAAAAPPVAPAAPATNRPDPVSVQALRAQLRGVALAIQEKRKQQDQIQQQIRSYQGRIQSSPQVEQEYKGLTRDHQTAQGFYERILNEANQAKMNTDLEHRQQGETFSVLDAANLPDSPMFPKQINFAAAGLVGGFVLGMIIVALLEYRDTALRTERDVWAFTQLPTLAVIAWSGDMANDGGGKRGWLKRLFSRKDPKKLLADAPG